MRGDIENTDDSRTASEAAADTTCCNFNILKVARYINLIVGTGCVVVCGLSAFNVFSVLSTDFTTAVALLQLDFYLG
jgi:hypothetical protein